MSSIIFEFNITELVALFGLAQCIYILVYIAFRSGRMSRVILPVIFFGVLAAAFLTSAAQRNWSGLISYYSDIVWLFWALCVPLSALLVLQVARITKPPEFHFWTMLILIPIAYGASILLSYSFGQFDMWLSISGIFVGGISLLLIWGHRDWLDNVHARKNGKERYWVIIFLVILNIALLATSLFFINQMFNQGDAELIRVIIGISFVYLVSTSLFRIYPHAVSVVPAKSKRADYLSDIDIEQALAIENLLNLEKVYQEPSYGRSEMARELEITESSLSRIVNIYFNKGVPQLLNDLRVKEAQTLLKQTMADIATISEEAGFNSIASFNRLFKEVTGVTPSEFRRSKKS